jgi:hypothetical protein
VDEPTGLSAKSHAAERGLSTPPIEHGRVDEPTGLWAKSHAAEGGLSTLPIEHGRVDEPTGLWAKSHAAERGLSTPPIILIMLTSLDPSQPAGARSRRRAAR